MDTVWKFHGEADLSVTGASERNSLTPSSVNERGQEPSSSKVTTSDDFAQRDYINTGDLFQDMGGSDGDGVGDDEQDDFLGPKMQRFLRTWLTLSKCMINSDDRSEAFVMTTSENIF